LDALRGGVGTSLTKIVDEVGLPINRLTAWRWRHRLLAALESSKPERLGGIVEVDETFFLRSFKGHHGWKRGQAPENRWDLHFVGGMLEMHYSYRSES
jgi:hypothetical protein